MTTWRNLGIHPVKDNEETRKPLKINNFSCFSLSLFLAEDNEIEKLESQAGSQSTRQKHLDLPPIQEPLP
jgi:hypothetical protein